MGPNSITEDEIKPGDWVRYYDDCDHLKISRVDYVLENTEDPICTTDGKLSANLILEVRHA